MILKSTLHPIVQNVQELVFEEAYKVIYNVMKRWDKEERKEKIIFFCTSLFIFSPLTLTS